jgi:tRNA A-37 threonylcarbamoyl transferase component Bud32
MKEGVDLQIKSTCEELFSPDRLIALASCAVDVRRRGYSILALLRGFREKTLFKSFEERGQALTILGVDERLFERDVRQATFNHLLAEQLIWPYKALLGKERLRSLEVNTSTLIVKNLIIDLISEYREAASLLLIQPEFFIHKFIQRQTRTCPPLQNLYLSRLSVRSPASFDVGMKTLEDEDVITRKGDFFKLNEEFAHKTLEEVRRTSLIPWDLVLSRLKGGRLLFFKPYQDVLAFVRSEVPQTVEVGMLREPMEFLFMQVGTGLVKLSERGTIEEAIKRAFPGRISRLKLKRMMSSDVLSLFNSVYEGMFSRNGERIKVVLKHYHDWTSAKWFPAALYTLGVQSFAVSGEDRMAREVAFNKIFNDVSIRTPSIIFVDWRGKVLCEEYVEGVSLSEAFATMMRIGRLSDEDEEVLKKVGALIAKAHKNGLVIGDCKPDNVIITPSGEVVLVDLEQARKNGNPAWDLAEFLGLVARFIPLKGSVGTFKRAVKSFMRGYVQEGGSMKDLRESVSVTYMRLFLPMLFPVFFKVLRVYNNALREGIA